MAPGGDRRLEIVDELAPIGDVSAKYGTFETDEEKKEHKPVTFWIKGGVCVLGVYILSSHLMRHPPYAPSSLLALDTSEERGRMTPCLSTISPPLLGIPAYERTTAIPGELLPLSLRSASHSGVPLPTNSWYQNLILGVSPPTLNNRAYTIPYVVDAFGPVAGIRAHLPYVDVGGDYVVQMSFDEKNGLTLGGLGADRGYQIVDDSPSFSPLGIRLGWEGMVAPVVRGMPYITVVYEPHSDVIPVVASDIRLASQPLVDAKHFLKCKSPPDEIHELPDKNGPCPPCPPDVCKTSKCPLQAAPYTCIDTGGCSATPWQETCSSCCQIYQGCAYGNTNDKGHETLIGKQHVKLQFGESDFTWMIFFSQPVKLTCKTNPEEAFLLTMEKTLQEEELVARMVISNNCTTGSNPTYCFHGQKYKDHEKMFEKHAGAYPYASQMNLLGNTLQFDWDARGGAGEDLLMYALPHHMDIMESTNQAMGLCTPSLNGPVCLVKGGVWTLEENVKPLAFTSSALPTVEAIAPLAMALNTDIHFTLPDYFMRGAGDTYFSGKMLAKLGRIILIAEELTRIAKQDSTLEVVQACQNAVLPSEKEIQDATSRLKAGVEIWLNGTAEAKFVYDSMWGGLVNCGCWFNGETQSCDNKLDSDCPAFVDPGLNFGNGYYNDHHFHYGYHIYAAAVAAKLDNDWGRANFQHVLLYVRDIANPSPQDKYFPVFRQKDWYLGSSWASGIAMLYLNGRNQESSSEAIAAYEGVGLFGSVMERIFRTDQDAANHKVAKLVSDTGHLLTSTEIRAADRYWHVYGDKHRVYPKQYKAKVVGMLWNTMAQFQTWFGPAPYLAYGIQLLPLTTVSERRDSLEWCTELYHDFAKSCESDSICEEQGWSTLQYAVLATIGHVNLALNKTRQIPPSAFTSAGGNGHSLSNTLYYISTRPSVHPFPITPPLPPATCVVPTCTKSALSTRLPDGSTCGDQISLLLSQNNPDACHRVARKHPLCRPCDPQTQSACPPCSPAICQELNQCSVDTSPYLCTDGPNRGGCSVTWWDPQICSSCCEVKRGCADDAPGNCGCPRTCHLSAKAGAYACGDRMEWLMETWGKSPVDACRQVAEEYPGECGGCNPDQCLEVVERCPPCDKDICAGGLNLCPPSDPFLCTEGASRGGCASHPWSTNCGSCCQIRDGCGD